MARNSRPKYVIVLMDSQGEALTVYGTPGGGVFHDRDRAEEMRDSVQRHLDKENAEDLTQHCSATVMQVGDGTLRSIREDGWF